MASLRLALKQLLQDTAGDLVNDRITPGARAQSNGTPALTYLIVSNIPQRDLDGFTGVAEARVEVAAWSQDLQEADGIIEQIRLTWLEYSGIVAGVQIDFILVDDNVRSYEVRGDGTDEPMFEVALDFLIGHQAAAAVLKR